MAVLLGEDRARKYATESRERAFLVKAANQSEYAEDVAAVVPVDYGDAHPRNAGFYAKEINAEQDPGCWWKWIVTVIYARKEGQEDPATNPEDNPLFRDPEITVDTETITIAARGEVDAGGVLTKAIATSAGEPYDPAPEEEIEILLINITRWELPNFSMAQYFDYQNTVNDASFIFGDYTIEEGHCKIRTRIGKRETHVANDGTETEFRVYEYSLAVSPLSWDIELLDFGTYYKDGSEVKKFLDEGKEFGLLDGAGGKLADGADPEYNKWQNKRRVDFGPLALPSGP